MCLLSVMHGCEAHETISSTFLTLSAHAEYMCSAASRTSCPDRVLVLRDFHKVVKWPGMVDFKVEKATGLKVLNMVCKDLIITAVP
jgi:hypothetical protein